MQHSADRDPGTFSRMGGAVTRAEAAASNKTAEPPLTSGFGAVIEKERDLQSATAESLGHVKGQHAAEIDRILHHHYSQLGANIALLKQRYEALPSPKRFVSWRERHHPPATPRYSGRHDQAELLPDLIAQHATLLAHVDALIECVPDGKRGELILSEVSRNHGEMACTLTAFLREDTAAAPIATETNPHIVTSTSKAEERWDNEGGPVRLTPATNKMNDCPSPTSEPRT